MTHLALPPRIAGTLAARYYGRPRVRNLFGLLAPVVAIAESGQPSMPKVPFVELLWMPSYAFLLRTVSKKGEYTIWTAVDAGAGMFSLFERHEQLEERELGEDIFPPLISQEAAETIARKGLLQFVMRQRGQFGKPTVEGVGQILLFYSPFWVFYYRRRRRLDLQVFDAYTGKDAGNKMRIAVLNAIIAKRKAAQTAAGESSSENRLLE